MREIMGVNVVAWRAWQSSKQKNKNKRKQKGSSELVCDPRTASAKPSLVMDLESVQGIATTAAATSATTPAHEKLDAAGCQALRIRALQRSAGLAGQYQILIVGGWEDESSFKRIHQDLLEKDHARMFNILP